MPQCSFRQNKLFFATAAAALVGTLRSGRCSFSSGSGDALPLLPDPTALAVAILKRGYTFGGAARQGRAQPEAKRDLSPGRRLRRQKTPNDFLCAITQEPMIDPVLAADGHTYERAAIETWLAQNRTRALSPKSGLPLANRTLVPNHALRGAIEQYQPRGASPQRAARRRANSPARQ